MKFYLKHQPSVIRPPLPYNYPRESTSERLVEFTLPKMTRIRNLACQNFDVYC